MAVDSSRAKTLFLHASDLADPAERAAYLQRECGEDAALRDRVEALLRADEGSPLPPPASELTAIDSASGCPTTEATDVHTSNPDDETFPISITAEYHGQPARDILIAGRYTLQEKIGEGGMGEVWVAKQSEPVKRKVALKLIKPGMDSRAVLQRFEQERQALALMDHPNIAKVLDAGMTPNGQPFFVMELVNGLPLTRFCDEARLTPRERLQLFVPICQAVQHAHQKGIVHRDLKPANILITIIDGKPVPKVIDFGVAKATAGKLTDESMSTQFGTVVGTLEYMSPEQAGFSGEDIDTRADIYSLGVILYELLTGLRPIDAKRLKKAALTEMIRIIREEQPSKPSTRLSTDEALPSLAAVRMIEPRKLMALLRGDLDWVVMKCLEKHRERRYETANALSRDVQRYLDGEAVEACPPSVGYRFGKFVKRHKGQVIAASLLMLALVGGIIGTSYGLFRADQARKAETRQRMIAEIAKKKAEERESQALDAVKRFGDAVAGEPELKNSPALAALRKRLLKEPLAFFKDLRDRLQADSDTRPESLRRLAAASNELGNLISEIGDKRDALILSREARAILQKLAEADPSAADLRKLLARYHYGVGFQLGHTGHEADAIKDYELALGIYRELAEADPTDAELQNFLASTYNSIGLMLIGTRRLADGRKSLESAQAIWRKLADANPTVAKHRASLADSHLNIGMLLSVAGNRAEALKEYESALAVYLKLAEADTQFQLRQGNVYNNIGKLMRDAEKLDDGLKAYQSALVVFRNMAEANPSATEYQENVADCHNEIGVLLSETGKPAEALKAFESAQAIQRKLVETNPTFDRFQNELALSHNNIGVLLKQAGKPAEALKAFESALAIERDLVREHADSPRFAKFARTLGGALRNVALVDLDAKKFRDARDRFREAIVWERKALAITPHDPRYRQSLVVSLAKLREAALGLGDAEGVAEAERELAKLHDSDPAMVALDARLSAMIKGEQKPKDEAERLQLAQRAYDKALYATAARLWGEALEANPKLGDDRQAQHRYNAACAATLTGCGKGKDDPSRDEAARAKLRQQALGWLKAELSAWKKVSTVIEPGNKELVAKTLIHWKGDADLAGIRDDAELAKLPEEERTAYKQLWDDVNALLTKVEGRK